MPYASQANSMPPLQKAGFKPARARRGSRARLSQHPQALPPPPGHFRSPPHAIAARACESPAPLQRPRRAVTFGAHPEHGALLVALLRIGGIVVGVLVIMMLTVLVLPKSACIEALRCVWGRAQGSGFEHLARKLRVPRVCARVRAVARACAARQSEH